MTEPVSPLQFPLQLPIPLDGLPVGVRHCIVQLLNIIQAQTKELQQLREENAQLRKEIAVLKGQKPAKGEGKPPEPSSPPKNRSSENERQESKPRERRRTPLEIDTTQRLCMDRTLLPPDAEFKGCEQTIIQDIVLRRNNIAFEREKYYSAMEGRSFLAPLPAEFTGSEYGPGVRSMVLVLHHACGVTQPKLLAFLESTGIQISSGEISNLLTRNLEQFHQEKTELFDAGLKSSPWQQIDDTGTPFDGERWHCHTVCNPLYTAFVTRPSKDRATVVEVLRNGRECEYRVSEDVIKQLRQLGVGSRWLEALATIPSTLVMTDDDLGHRLAACGSMSSATWKKIADACLVEGYRRSTDGPVVKALLTDDAATFRGITEEHGLCWVHEGRLFKCLTPAIALFAEEREKFLDGYWDYYRQLRAFRSAPCPDKAKQLSAQFDKVFSMETTYIELGERIALSRAKKDELLLVLTHPELPLHNNEAELAARDRVRKRDISLSAHSIEGIAAWDTFQSIVATARKLGVGIVDYIQDRLRGVHKIPRLADLIRQKAAQLHLGASWEAPLLTE